MNFDLTDEQKRWRDFARDFAQGKIRPRTGQLDREQKFPYGTVNEMARLGLMGLTLPEEYGGSGGDFVAYNLALEEICRADTPVGITMEAHISLGCAPVAAYGTPEQKEKFLSRCTTGERLWAFGITEEEAGTDAGGTRTTAELEAGEWVINGSKKWIANSGTDIQGRSFGREVSMAKVFASAMAKRAADQAARIWGGEGFMEGSAVAPYWRQVKINEIGEGTSEIIARSLLQESAEKAHERIVAR